MLIFSGLRFVCKAFFACVRGLESLARYCDKIAEAGGERVWPIRFSGGKKQADGDMVTENQPPKLLGNIA